MIAEDRPKGVYIGRVNEHPSVVGHKSYDFLLEDCVVSNEDVVLTEREKRNLLAVLYVGGQRVKLLNGWHAFFQLKTSDRDDFSLRPDQPA